MTRGGADSSGGKAGTEGGAAPGRGSFFERESRLFFTALMFYTRIPVPAAWVSGSAGDLNRSTRYFPLIGWIVGGLSFSFCLGLSLLLRDGPWRGPALGELSPFFPALLGLGFAVLLTGAFHEDGFADVCDGMGGHDVERKLEIMKDSRLGTFGGVGLFFILAARLVLMAGLLAASSSQGLFFVVAGTTANAAARVAPVVIMLTAPYLRLDQSSKAKPVAQGIRLGSVWPALLFGLLPLGLFVALLGLSWLWFVGGLALAGLLAWLARRFFLRILGGYTGDCLGAAEQLGEVLFLLFGLVAVGLA